MLTREKKTQNKTIGYFLKQPAPLFQATLWEIVYFSRIHRETC